MRVESLSTLSFRNLADDRIELGDRTTLLWGANGAGKTNLLEALYMALTGRSCRTTTDRETIRFGAELSRAEAVVSAEGPSHEFLCSVSADQGRRHLVDGSEAVRASDLRPPVAVFMPDRLVLIKGPPVARRSHLDAFMSALRPSLAPIRSRYARALQQRNALLSAIRRGGSDESLGAWDQELAEAGIELIEARTEVVARLAPPAATAATALGLPGFSVAYRPRSSAASAAELREELGERHRADIARGHSGHGPHLDELMVTADGKPLRRYGSQGQQRTALLAILFAERELLADSGRPAPLMLLDDVTSELDPDHRERLCALLDAAPGQALITATEPEHLPVSHPRLEIHVDDGRVVG